MPDGDQRTQVIQEAMGLTLIPGEMRFEKFHILYGQGANGKSTILNLWEQMLGSSNVSHVPLKGLNARFSPFDMNNKLANLAADMDRMDKVEEGILKQLTSGDPIQADRKYRDPVTMRPTARLVFAANDLPPIMDRSEGIWRRMIAIPFNVQFKGEEKDQGRARDLQKELPGILNWALEGLVRLYKQDGFTRCPVCEEAVIQHRDNSDPFRQFIDENAVLSPESSVLSIGLYERYSKFCELRGYRAKGYAEFGKQVVKLEGVWKDRVKTANGRQYRYNGICLNHSTNLCPQDA